MTIDEYRLDFLDTVSNLAEAAGYDSIEVFTQLVSEILVENNHIINFQSARFEGIDSRMRRIAVNGYSVDELDGSISLLLSDYDGGEIPTQLTRTKALELFDYLICFVDAACSVGFDVSVSNNMEASALVSILRENKVQVRKYKLILLTDKLIGERIDFPLKISNSFEADFDFSIWDMGRLYRFSGISGEREELSIDLTEYIECGLPCVVPVFSGGNGLVSFLCSIPATILADLYDVHGSRLLEGNVRSFLSTKRAVNKKIRETIIAEPEHFFAFNNGVSAVARKVDIQESASGPRIVHITGFQIVNGGQTTASLATARYKEESDLKDIHVPMKVTCIAPSDSAVLIPKISRSSNSQNKVSDADFFSNHEFHVRMEEISRRIFAPSLHGSQFMTHWYYERATGQYQQDMAYLTKDEKTRFILENPKYQMIKKTDLARVRMLWLEAPHIVSFGTQKNFIRFAEYITKLWEEDNTIFNEKYFKDSIALTILYKNVERLVEIQPWYVKGGYRAAYVSYTISLLHHEIHRQFRGQELDLGRIWDIQYLPDVLPPILEKLAKAISEVLLAPDRSIVNVTEWAKREACWERIKAINITINPALSDWLIDKEKAKYSSQQAKKSQKTDNSINAQNAVLQLGENYFTALSKWYGILKLQPVDRSLILRCVLQLQQGGFPSEIQCNRLLIIRSRMMAEGFRGPGDK